MYTLRWDMRSPKTIHENVTHGGGRSTSELYAAACETNCLVADDVDAAWHQSGSTSRVAIIGSRS